MRTSASGRAEPCAVLMRRPAASTREHAEPLGRGVELAAGTRADHRLGMLARYGLHTEAKRCAGRNPGTIRNSSLSRAVHGGAVSKRPRHVGLDTHQVLA